MISTNHTSETFPILKWKKICHLLRHAAACVLEAWDHMMADGTFASLDLSPV
jgi:hypothetical protein